MTLDLTPQIEQLRQAQTKWSALTPSKRLDAVRRLRGLVSDASRGIARVIAEENGKTELEALTQEIMPFLDTCLFLERRAEAILSDKPLEFESKLFFAGKKQNRMVHAPCGVIGILGTWNYAFFLNLTQALFALTAGNAVYLKFSELSPKVAGEIERLMKEARFPEGLIRIAVGGAEEGRALTEAKCDKYILTGSRAVGRAVLGRLAEDLKPAIVELSGSDAYLIFSDADWKLAVKSLIWATFQYSGQTCVAPRRVVVLDSDREKFIQIFKETAAACAGFVDSQGKVRLEKFAADERRKLEAVQKAGGKLIWKSARSEGASVVAPQLWSVPAPEAVGEPDWMSPAIFLLTVRDEEGMVRAANSTPSGLGASVWTRSRSRAARVSARIRSGQLWVNDTLFSVALGEAPFGGFGDSGFGKTRGPEGLLEMTEPRLVSSDFRRVRINLHLPPYMPNSYGILTAIQKIWFGTKPFVQLTALGDLMRACVTHDPAQKK